MAAGRAKKELSESEVAEVEWCLSFFPLSLRPILNKRALFNLVPRVSHLTAWGERGGGKMRDPGNEVEPCSGGGVHRLILISLCGSGSNYDHS